MTSALVKVVGFDNVEVAEDIVQETLLKAKTSWESNGVPDNPPAWLYTVAKRKAIDWLREQQVRKSAHTDIARHSEYLLVPSINQQFESRAIEDSQLAMIFACCHPAIPHESQIALALKTLCGLSVGEIARNFLTSVETITKRLFRARERFREANVTLELPPISELSERLNAVLDTIYLMFNEGYHSAGVKLIRNDLCEEAIRLTFFLSQNPLTNTSTVNALMALMCFQASREDARLDASGQIVLLQHQDRSKWNHAMIQKGKYYLNVATAGDETSAFHLEAAIAAYHAMAKDFESTPWKQIHYLYQALAEIKPGPIVAMNCAIALGYSQSFSAAIDALIAIPDLNDNYLYHAVLGDFYERTYQKQKALHHYKRALQLVSSAYERTLIERKLESH